MSSPQTSEDLQIVGAVYGLGSVTDTVIDQVDRSSTPQSLTVVASNDVFGDTWPGTPKTLTVAYRWGDTGAVCVGVVEEGQILMIGEAQYEQAQQLPPVVPSTDPTLSILAATYGPSVVTATLQADIDPATQSVAVVADNATFGPDPWPGVPKTLVVVAVCTGQVPYVDIVQEGQPYATQYRPPLQIISASWGLQDVTAAAQALIEQQSLTVNASNDVFGDGWPGTEKTLDVVYQYGDQQQQLAITTEGNTLQIDYTPLPPAQHSPDPKTLTVIKAAYGTADVTAQVIGLISGQSLDFVADNATFGDSWPGTAKSFELAYSWGPSTSSNIVVAENTQVQISQPPVAFTQGMFTLGDLIADGDAVALGAPNGYLLAVDPSSGAVLANGAERSAQVAFTVHAADQLGQFTMTDSQQRPACVGPDGTLACVAGGTAAVLVFSMTTSGAITLGVVGASQCYSIVQDDGTVLAGGSDTATYNASYRLELQPCDTGADAHLAAYASVEATDLPSAELLKLTWDLTGGFFLAIGLGPLLAGESKAAPGIYKLICTNPEVKAALDAIWLEVRANPYSTLSVASLFSFVGTVWDAGLMLKIFRLALNIGMWWLIGLAVAKLLEWSVLPEAAAAELVASFAIWAYTTTMDALAYINSGSGSSAAAAARVAAQPELVTV